ncbi:MAG: MFS transporter [Chloroflexi bacterium]|nr:MFS transporter [Chloroflexota bacterium]
MSRPPIAPVVGATPLAHSQGRIVLAARLVVLVTFLDLFIQFPVVAPYATTLGADPLLVGVIVAVYSATNLVGNLLAGPVLDRWGRTGPVAAGLLLSSAALGAYALAPTAGALLVVRAAHGLTTAVLTPGAFALLGDVATADRRARVMGVSGALIAVAAIVGPPLAGITRDRLGPEIVFLGGAAMMLLTAALFRWLAPGDRPAPGVRRLMPAAPSSVPLWTIATTPRLLVACLAALALTVGLGMLVTHLPQALVARGESAARSGLAFSVYALVAMGVMAGPLNRLSDRAGRTRPIAAGLVLIAAGLITLGLAGDMIGVAGGMALFGFGFGLLFPAASALVAEATAAAERGRAFGIFYAVYSAGVVAGSLLSGAIAAGSGSASGAPFFWGAAVALAVAPVVLALARYADTRPPASA